MENSRNDFKFLALVNKDDSYYHAILDLILKHNATILDKDEMDSGIEFQLRFTEQSSKANFEKELLTVNPLFLQAV